MREILFRGKRVYNGEWVEGCLVIATDGGEAVHYILPVGVERWGGAEFAEGWSVDPSTLGQYTGLTANGKKIFEGDIVEYHWGEWDKTGHIVLTRWENKSCGFEPFSDSLENCQHCGGGLCPEECEVVGNVHDNPELLEVDE